MSIIEINEKLQDSVDTDNEEIICGIDLGLATMGYGILNIIKKDGIKKYEYIKHGCIETSSKKIITERLNEIYMQLEAIIKLYEVKRLVIERVFHSSNTRTVNCINQVHGIVYLLVHKNSLVYREYTPLEIKKVLLHTKANKKEMITKVREVFSIPIDIKLKDDAADALAIAYTFFIKHA